MNPRNAQFMIIQNIAPGLAIDSNFIEYDIYGSVTSLLLRGEWMDMSNIDKLGELQTIQYL